MKSCISCTIYWHWLVHCNTKILLWLVVIKIYELCTFHDPCRFNQYYWYNYKIDRNKKYKHGSKSTSIYVLLCIILKDGINIIVVRRLLWYIVWKYTNKSYLPVYCTYMWLRSLSVSFTNYCVFHVRRNLLLVFI